MAQNQTGRRLDPWISSGFRLVIGEVEEGEFQEVSGISNETEVVEFQEGGENTYSHKFRGKNKYPNLVLRHGVTRLSPAIWAWREAVIHRKTPPLLDMSVIKLDDTGEEVCRWVFRNCWPVKWQGPDFKAGASELAIETLEIAHDGYYVELGG